MRSHIRRRTTVVAAGGGFLVTTALAAGIAFSAPNGLQLTNVNPNPKAPGVVAADVLSPELQQVARAQGAIALENPTTQVPYYGYDGDKPNMVPLPSSPTSEAHKTEPDKNTYLVFDKSLPGADPTYDYGTHFLFQGHESGTPGYITRINLDADTKHRVTLLATQDVTGKNLPDFDGSTWDPFAKRLLLTSEGSATSGGVWASDLGVPAKVEDVSGITGRGGYEGIQTDDLGNLYLVEDSGGKAGPTTPNAKQANSFVYRLLLTDPADISKGGRLQALQVTNGDHPITFHAGQADADILGQDIADLHTYGKSFTTKWVTIHDTAVDGFTPFDANTKAKAASATPFKRPENGVFRPDGKFGEFFFTETGDTNANTEAGALHGGFGGILKLNQNPRSNDGALSLFYRSDVAHTGFDNIQFLGKDALAVVEDAGDGLHTQRNAFDSGYLFDTGADYSNGRQPVRFLAQGRDASATIDSACSTCGNDGDNEITGIHASDGDPTVKGVLGTKAPSLFKNGWRLFYTRQHGDNVTFEILPQSANTSNGNDHKK
ncbi:MAG: hypothetical protein JWN29_3964 [Acidimicrobiales bacterium]|nr:hypothetical protein [Acidimicrobiales bacterium]